MTPQIKDLQARANTAFKAMQEMNSKAFNEQRSFNGEEESKFNALSEEFDSARASIERLENLAKQESFLNERASALLPEEAKETSFKDTALEARASTQEAEQTRAENDFYEYLRSGTLKSTLQRDLSAGAADKGGVLIPTTLQTKIRNKLTETLIIYQIASHFASNNDVEMPIGSDVTGFAWIDEKGAYPELDTAFDKLKISAYKIGGVIKLSAELLNDSPQNIENYITERTALYLRRTLEDTFINGDGKKKPTGLSVSAKEGLRLATAQGVTSDELVNFMFSLKAPYAQNACWLVSDDFAKAIYKLVDKQGRPLFLPALSQGAPETLLGKKMLRVSAMDGFASGKVPAFFGDFKYYEIWTRKGMSFERINELFTLTDQIGVKVSQRLDAKLTDDEAVKKLVCP